MVFWRWWLYPTWPRQLRPKLQGDPAGQVPGELVPPFPSVVGDDFTRQRVVGVVVRAFWGKLPGFSRCMRRWKVKGALGKLWVQPI